MSEINPMLVYASDLVFLVCFWALNEFRSTLQSVFGIEEDLKNRKKLILLNIILKNISC